MFSTLNVISVAAVRSVANGPKRHFTAVNCRIALDSFDHLVGDGEHRWRLPAALDSRRHGILHREGRFRA
jgi:hypothetical protein